MKRKAPRTRTDVLKWKRNDGSVSEAFSEDAKSELLAEYYEQLFSDASAAEHIPGWIYGEFTERDIRHFRSIDGYFLKEIVVGMKKGKSCAEEDLIVVEMLLYLPEEVYDLLAALFLDRLLHRNAPNDTLVWAFHSVSLIAKCAGAQFVTQFRPIALLPVLYKWYSRMLLELGKPKLQKLSKYQFAFRKGYQANEVLFILRNLVEKANEWQTIPPGHLFVLDGDVFKVYDETTHSTFIKAAARKKLDRVLVAAWVREIRSMVSSFKLGSISTRYVKRERSLVQGDPAAPYLFNVCLDSAIEEFVEECQRHGWGYDLDGMLLPILVFADNFWLISNSPIHLQVMFRVWLHILKDHGWHVPVDECTWCTTAADAADGNFLDAQGQCVRRSPRDVGFKALGSYVTFDNSCTKELLYRVGQSWKAFGSHRDMLRSPKSSLRKRFALLDSVAFPSVSWGGATWTPTQKYLDLVWTTQHKIMKSMLGMRRRSGEEGEDFHYRVNLHLKRLRTSFANETWGHFHCQNEAPILGAYLQILIIRSGAYCFEGVELAGSGLAEVAGSPSGFPRTRKTFQSMEVRVAY